MTVLRTVYSPSIVCLSFGIAFLGSYLTITFAELLRRALSSTDSPKLLGRWELLGAMAISLGGIGIWSMHFIGMSSLKLFGPNDVEVVAVYNLVPTLVSNAIVILLEGAGLYIASMDPMFGKTKTEIINTFVKETSRLSLKDILHISHFKMLRIISTQSLGYLVCGGIIAGAGVSVMHYMGMWALHYDDGVIHWNAGIITASILIAIIASTVAFWILFRLLSLYPHLEVLRVTSAFLMAIAVTGMHYTGMMAADFYVETNEEMSVTNDLKTVISSYYAFYGTLLAALMLSIVLVMLAFAEHRHRMYQLSAELKRFKDVVIKLRNTDSTFEKLTIDAYLLRMNRSPGASVVTTIPQPGHRNTAVSFDVDFSDETNNYIKGTPKTKPSNVHMV